MTLGLILGDVPERESAVRDCDEAVLHGQAFKGQKIL